MNDCSPARIAGGVIQREGLDTHDWRLWRARFLAWGCLLLYSESLVRAVSKQLRTHPRMEAWAANISACDPQTARRALAEASVGMDVMHPGCL